MENENNSTSQIVISIILMLTLTLIPIFYAGFDNWSLYGFFILISVASIYLIIKTKIKINFNFCSPILWITLFFLWGLISFIWSVSKVRTIIEAIQLLTYILVFSLMLYAKEDTKEKVGKVTLLIGTLIAIYGIAQYIFINSILIIGTFPHHNPFGIYLVMLFSVSWSVYLKKNSKMSWISSIILLVALFLSASRGAILCLALSFWIIFIGFNKKQLFIPVKKSILGLISSLGVTYLVIYISPFIQKLSIHAGFLIKSLIRIDDFGPSAVDGRLSFWRVAFKLFISKPITGYGLGTYYTAYYSKYEYNGWYSRFAHNTYLQILSEQGIIGFILFIMFLFTCIIIVLKIVKKKKANVWVYGAIAGSLAFLLHIGIDYSWSYPGACIIFFALIGALISLDIEKENNKISISNKLIIGVLTITLVLTLLQFSTEYIGSKALNLSNEKKYTESNKIYETIEKYYPINDRIYYLHALNNLVIYSQNKNINELNQAEDQLINAIKFGQYDWNYYNQLGLIKSNLGLINESIEYFKKSSQYSAYRIDPYLNLGTAYYYISNINKAKETFIKGLEQQKYASTGLDETEKNNVTTMIAQMNLDLAIIYSKDNNNEMKNKYLSEVNKIIKEHPEVKLYNLKDKN